MRIHTVSITTLLVGVFALAAYAAPRGPSDLPGAKSPAWSVRASQSEMIVAVSPIRQSIQVAGASVAILGAGIDAIVNAKHRDAVRAALEGYNPGAVFEDRLAKRLEETLPKPVTRAPVVTSTAGYQNLEEAEQVRLKALAKSGCDVFLDLKMTYGLFGYDGILVAKLEGRLIRVADKKRLWKGSVVVSTEPILACDKLADPTKRMAPNLSSPRFSVEDDAVAKWTGEGGKILKARFETAVDGAISALLCDLGLVKESVGEYYLGKLAMNRKKFEQADAHFVAALAVAPGDTDAVNGRSVNLAHNKQLDDAIRLASELTTTAPDYAPAWFNLAWWHAVVKKDKQNAKPFYDKALSLGMARNERIDKALEK